MQLMLREMFSCSDSVDMSCFGKKSDNLYFYLGDISALCPVYHQNLRAGIRLKHHQIPLTAFPDFHTCLWSSLSSWCTKDKSSEKKF